VGGGRGNTHLFIVFLPSATRLYEDKRLGTLDLARVHALALSMLGCEVVRSTIKVLECGEDLGEVALGRFEHWEDVFERWKGKQEVVG
jgi:hypothetical protein